MKVEFDVQRPFSDASIVLTCAPGGDLYDCKMQAVAIAAKTLCTVSFRHNGVDFIVYPEDIYSTIKQLDK